MLTWFVKEVTLDTTDGFEPDLQYKNHLYYPMTIINGVIYVADDWGNLNQKRNHNFKVAKLVEGGIVLWDVDKDINGKKKK